MHAREVSELACTIKGFLGGDHLHRRLFVPGRGGWWQLLHRHDAKETERRNARQARRKDAEGAEA